jgi:hypothetical protein
MVEAALVHHPKAHFSSANVFCRFLHDKNSREFLYYRKKVAEMRKEAQKSQAAPQKGKCVQGWEEPGSWTH